MTDTEAGFTLSASPANDNGRTLERGIAPGVIGGIKSLLCDGCGRRAATIDGYCDECVAEADTLRLERSIDWKGERF